MMNRANSFGSVSDFQSRTTGQDRDVLSESMAKLNLGPNPTRDFISLYQRYTESSSSKLEWEHISPPSSSMLLPYDDTELIAKKKKASQDGQAKIKALEDDKTIEEGVRAEKIAVIKAEIRQAHEEVDATAKEYLNQLVVLKLNGGLGTTMGCKGPKSAIEVRSGMTFLDLTVRQIEYLNDTYGVDVPLVLMNSFNTHEDTQAIIRKYSNANVTVYTFMQNQFPRIWKDTSLPIPQSENAPKEEWYPPGHGDVYSAFWRSGLLEQLVAQGKKQVFISNIDNLGATVDLSILSHMCRKEIKFIMEVTPKTRADVKGGTLINYNNKVRLLEIAQVPPSKVNEFKNPKLFGVFNTNNLWVDMEALLSNLKNETLSLDIIVNNKSLHGKPVIQLETAAGAAIQHFAAQGIRVPRSRFLPVKSCSDLMLVQSNLYELEHGTLRVSQDRQFSNVPVVKLGPEFKKIEGFESRVKAIPNVLQLDSLTINGDVKLGENVEFRGSVMIIAEEGKHIDIPDGSLLQDCVVTGSLRIHPL